jgi:hypothetical protein
MWGRSGARAPACGRHRMTTASRLGTQCLVLLLLPRVVHPWLFGAGLSYVLLCYGGGFGTMRSLVLDLYGARLMPSLYGAVLTAWSLAGVVGPQMVAGLKDHFPNRAGELSFQIGAALVALGLVLHRRRGPELGGVSEQTARPARPLPARATPTPWGRRCGVPPPGAPTQADPCRRDSAGPGYIGQRPARQLSVARPSSSAALTPPGDPGSPPRPPRPLRSTEAGPEPCSGNRPRSPQENPTVGVPGWYRAARRSGAGDDSQLRDPLGAETLGRQPEARGR